MNFRSPAWLWLLAALPLVLPFLIARERRRTAVARQFIAERLRGVRNPLRVVRPFLLAAGAAALSFALAGPYAGFQTVAVSTRDANRIIAIDVSNSMAAEDIGTARLAGAKAIAKRMINGHQGRVGLIVFEAASEVVSPLTNDTDAVIALLETLQPGEVGTPGSDLGGAVLAALKVLDADAGQKADVVIISDGEEQGRRVDEAINRARARGVQVSGIVIGSADGSNIPVRDGVLKDESGDVIITYARSDVLERLARGTGGTTLENPFSEHELEPLMARATAGAARTAEVRVPIDRFQWPMSIAFLALFCASLVNRGSE